MATKVIILGQEEKQQTKKPIEFVKFMSDQGVVHNTDASSQTHAPSFYENIELLCRGYSQNGFDLMFAYNKNRNDKKHAVLFLGYFNDGVVE